MSATVRTSRPLPVLCTSLGGTKIEVGALQAGGAFTSSGELAWRSLPAFAPAIQDTSDAPFCDAIAAAILAFLSSLGLTLNDVDRFGFPFPGPNRGELWYSNNLSRAFIAGVPLARSMAAAFRRHGWTGSDDQIDVAFDAQCDAAGELWHPEGRLRDLQGHRDDQCATVLNLATGVAAGFVAQGTIIRGDRAFKSRVDRRYDAGAGQLGRHLWLDPETRVWSYHFAPDGATPDVPPPAVRLTDRLSGPALAARVLQRLHAAGALDAPNRLAGELPIPELRALAQRISELDAERRTDKAADIIRHQAVRLGRALIEGCDATVARDQQEDAACVVNRLGQDVAAELAAALRAWSQAPSWHPYLRRLVLTGGVGIRFLASSDELRSGGFIGALRTALPESVVDRSALVGATEREAYLFRSEVA